MQNHRKIPCGISIDFSKYLYFVFVVKLVLNIICR